MTDKCNLHCKHCSVNNITAIVHPYHQIKKEMQILYDKGVRILFFCGGETFLWKDNDKTLRDLVIGMDAENQRELDYAMINADGTKTKSKFFSSASSKAFSIGNTPTFSPSAPIT